MKTLKRIGLIFALLIVLLLLIGFFLPRHVSLQRGKVIKASPETLFHLVNDLHYWEEWSPWHQLDKTMEITYGGSPVGTGSYYSWKSTNPDVGNGKLTIIQSVPNDSILLTMDFMENGTANAVFYFKPTSDGTEVIWSFSTDLGNNPVARYFGLLMERFIGPDYEKGLLALSDLAAKTPSASANQTDFGIEVVETQTMQYVSILDTCSEVEIGRSLGECYMKLAGYLEAKRVKQSAPPMAFYHAYSPDKIVMEPAIPFEGKLEGQGAIMVHKKESVKAAMVSFLGAYEKTGLAHDAIQKWMAAQQKAPTGSPYEVYVTDPMVEKDTAKWLTQIYYPL